MPGFALSPRLIKIRDNYSNEAFMYDMFILFSFLFTGGLGTGTGAVAVTARGFLGRMASGAAIKFKGKAGAFLAGLIASLCKEILEWALSGDKTAQEGIKAIIYETTGLELETLDAEGAKHAIGQLLADKINAKYGTNFNEFYPPENIVEDIKAQLLAEILTAVDESIA
jgi:hypothetical protein